MYKKLSEDDFANTNMKDYLKVVKMAVSLPEGWGPK